MDRRDSVKATGEFITLTREWLRSQGYTLHWCWVQEWGPVNGGHCHILLHIPPVLDPLFRRKPLKWARKVLGGQYAPKVAQSQRVRFSQSATANPAAYEAALLGKAHYMLKFAPAALEGKLGMSGKGHAPWGQSCLVHGKRAGVSQRN